MKSEPGQNLRRAEFVVSCFRLVVSTVLFVGVGLIAFNREFGYAGKVAPGQLSEATDHDGVAVSREEEAGTRIKAYVDDIGEDTKSDESAPLADISVSSGGLSEHGSNSPTHSSEAQMYSDVDNSLVKKRIDNKVESFSVGSNESEVLAVMGVPDTRDEIGDETWLGYKQSRVILLRGNVHEYRNAGNLRVVEEVALDYTLKAFTVGSSTKELISVMGTPTERSVIGSQTWLYFGRSRVVLEDDVVTQYRNQGDLKVALTSSDSISSAFYVGATEAEVIAVMGTPTAYEKVGRETWMYFGLSRVVFEDGRVTKYSNRGDLKIK